MSAIAQTSVSRLTISYPLLPEDFALPDDPVENTDQPLLASALRQPLTAFPDLMQDALVVSNFALCTAIEQRIICKAPDWMYVRPIQPWQMPQPRRSYTPNTEGTVPQVVMEFLSATYGEEYSVEFTEGVKDSTTRIEDSTMNILDSLTRIGDLPTSIKDSLMQIGDSTTRIEDSLGSLFAA